MGRKDDREAYCHFGAHCWVLKKCLLLRSPRVDVGIDGYDDCFLPIGCNSQSIKRSLSLSEHATDEGIHN